MLQERVGPADRPIAGEQRGCATGSDSFLRAMRSLWLKPTNNAGGGGINRKERKGRKEGAGKQVRRASIGRAESGCDPEADEPQITRITRLKGPCRNGSVGCRSERPGPGIISAVGRLVIREIRGPASVTAGQVGHGLRGRSYKDSKATVMIFSSKFFSPILWALRR